MRSVKIGFIPAHREPFGEDWGAQMRERCLRELHKVAGLEVVVPDESLTRRGLVRSLQDGAATLKLFQDQQVAGVLVGGMTFGQEVSAVGAIIANLPKDTPVLQFATKGSPLGESGIRESDSWCGNFMIASAMKRRGIVFEHIPTCLPEEPEFRSHVQRFTRACLTTQGFRGARIGHVGVRPEEFESVWWDEASLQKSFNQTVVPIEQGEMFDRMQAVPPDSDRVKSLVAEISRGVDVSQMPPAALANVARAEIALLEMAAAHGVVAMGVNCWMRVQHTFGISVCSALGRVTDQGVMCSCEVDVYGACSMWAAYLAGFGSVSPHFIDWTELHPNLPNVWLAWHCGNSPRSLCQEGCSPCMRQHSIMPDEGTHGTLEFKMRPGPVTCARLVEYDGNFTMFIGRGEIIDCGPYTRGSYGWVKVADIMDWERKMIEHGIIHHGVLIHDPEAADALASFCRFNGIQVVWGK